MTPHINIEIKAKTKSLVTLRHILLELKADYRGLDMQLDTYFNVRGGRLKIRQGTIENALVYYNRQNITGPKKSDVFLQNLAREEIEGIKKILTSSLGVLVEVYKKRDIYYIGNVKFHLDDIPVLGNFVEIEAIDKKGNIGLEHLTQQVQEYSQLFKIKQEDLIHHSYSDMILQKGL